MPLNQAYSQRRLHKHHNVASCFKKCRCGDWWQPSWYM